MKPDTPRTMSPPEAKLFAMCEARGCQIEQLVDEDPELAAAVAGASLDVWADFTRKRARQRVIEGRS